MAEIRRSPRAALRWAMQVGLPATAILIAVNPIWGFSWFFNSESWATGIWDHWAASRTDTWREAMIRAVNEQGQAGNISADQLFQLKPAGIDEPDFSFIVIGDTGEGGAAQFSLKNQLLEVGRRSDVKFLVVSSDVIYPAGAMIDYEPCFYLPFKNFPKPIYAIPGNHDWYDALEGFCANLCDAESARASMMARITVDNRVTLTREHNIENMIQEAARLRQEYGVITGLQRGPFFEIQTDRFALIAVDTGVLKSVDPLQWKWLKAALARSKGKLTLAILGHPFYAGGRFQAAEEPFAAVHRLLREHEVEIIMAGDTHDLEHYQESLPSDGPSKTVHHFVNGGGGAYLSIGTPMDWPKTPALADFDYYPSKANVIAKLDAETPKWKWPLWMWAKHMRAWPTNVELLAGAFEYNRAPFYQSFVEVRVERSQNRVRILPYGSRGQLRWKDFEISGATKPADKSLDDFVEYVAPMR